MFGETFSNDGDTLKHGVQNDEWSCGIVTPNTIGHNIFGDPIFRHDNRRLMRMQYFVRFAKAQLEQVRDIINLSIVDEAWQPDVSQIGRTLRHAFTGLQKISENEPEEAISAIESQVASQLCRASRLYDLTSLINRLPVV